MLPNWALFGLGDVVFIRLKVAKFFHQQYKKKVDILLNPYWSQCYVLHILRCTRPPQSQSGFTVLCLKVLDNY